MDTGTLTYLGMVFVAVFLLAQGMIVPAFGESRQTRKRLQKRLGEIDRANDSEAITSLLRAKYLRELKPFEASLESLPMMESLARTIEQSGHKILAYRLVVLSVALSIVFTLIAWNLLRMPLATGAAAIIGLMLPYFKIQRDRSARFVRFEEQLPDAIDVMRRALMAGHPFNAALDLVSEDMDDPIAKEFKTTFADVNYGNDVRRAMLGLLARIPSVTVMALVTSVLVQRETGGNLAEILEQIAKVIRGRFRFQRRVVSLSAEGRMSAWVLAMVPLGLFMAMYLITPDYFPIMFESPTGRNVVLATFLWAAVGVFFIRKIIRIDV